MKKYLNLLTKNIFIVCLCFFALVAYLRIVFCEINIHPAPEWSGLVPGKTTKEDVIFMLGQPDENYIWVEGLYEIEFVNYEDRPEIFSGWNNVQLFFERRDNKAILVGAKRKSLNFYETKIYHEDIRMLEQLIAIYGKPEKVKWYEDGASSRVLIWASYGVAVVADSSFVEREWDEFVVSQILIFEPMSINKFLDTYWTRFAIQWSNKRHYRSSALDEEDPYDWSNIPRP